MAYTPNPFLERRSDRTTSDQEFVGLFSPEILRHLPDEVFLPGVHVFHSPPGGGKTTLLRALSPGVLRSLWNARSSDSTTEALEVLSARGVFDSDYGPLSLGVVLSCAAGYADLPSGVDLSSQELFRALFDSRVVLRTLRGLALLLGFEQPNRLKEIRLGYQSIASEFKSIPLLDDAKNLLDWAEKAERQIYLSLDSIDSSRTLSFPRHVRFEGLLWLESVQFIRDDQEVNVKRHLMVDDLHKLRESQRQFLIQEFTELRPTIPVWLAQRSIALGSSLLSPGGRVGRDLSAHSIEDLWSSGRGSQQFATFASNVLDRRMANQVTVHSQSFSPHLRPDINEIDAKDALAKGVEAFKRVESNLANDDQYSEWLKRARALMSKPTLENVKELYKIRIQIARHQRKRQLRLDLAPLTAEELDNRDQSKEEQAAEIFMHEELGIPYYFGFERVAALATNNVEELLQLAAVLFDGLKTKQILRHREPIISPLEQEKILKEAAKNKMQFIPRNHTEGTYAQRLLTAIGTFCRERTFEPNAPYAPGVTGIKVSEIEILRLERGENPYGEDGKRLIKVLSECVAENLLVKKVSSATTNRDSGFVFYLNRTLCVQFGLPIQYGGWQEVESVDLINWLRRGPSPTRRRRLDLQ